MNVTPEGPPTVLRRVTATSGQTVSDTLTQSAWVAAMEGLLGLLVDKWGALSETDYVYLAPSVAIVAGVVYLIFRKWVLPLLET